MAATSHPLASLAAIEVLRAGRQCGGRGGDGGRSAVRGRAAMTGIGGDCFAMIAEPGPRKDGCALGY